MEPKVIRSEIDALSENGEDGEHVSGDGLWIDPETINRQVSASRWTTLAAVAGNVLEWYDFAVFGYLSDVLGKVFFPPGQVGNASTLESFAVFGGAFLVRPLGGIWMGYIGDRLGRKQALILSIFLMAGPTFAMGCLPTYQQIGPTAIVLLIVVRLLQGLSVGGQLMSSLVFTLEQHPRSQWGWYGSFVMGSANLGSLLGSVVGYVLRLKLTDTQLEHWGWRIPFLAGILVSFSGCYLRSVGDDHTGRGYTTKDSSSVADDIDEDENEGAGRQGGPEDHLSNPLAMALSRPNRRALGAAAMVPMLWSAGFYLSFVWMAIYMEVLIEHPVPHAFGVNALAMLLSLCLCFPCAGWLSDRYGRRRIMTFGGVALGCFAPVAVTLIGQGNAFTALGAQLVLGICLSFWGAPMCAWLVEGFAPEARLTSVAIGYNVAQALAGGSAPALATLLVDRVGPNSPGWLMTFVAGTSLTGLWCVAPLPKASESVEVGSSVEFVAVSKSED